MAPQTVLDKAELLREQLRVAAVEAAQIRVQVGGLEQHPGVVRVATSPAALAVAAAASSLHAAVHAMSLVAAELCGGDRLAATVDTSSMRVTTVPAFGPRRPPGCGTISADHSAGSGRRTG